ncbi:MAG: FtsX-like permease family protein, partial [Bacillales bacterium]
GETFPGLYFPETLREKIYANKSSASGIFNLVVKDGYSLDVVRTQVLELLNEDLDNTMKFVDFTEEIDKDIKESIGSVTIFLALIGTISLIVAGINVVNIMYISALEKMNEVAVCRALGMRKRTVIVLFLMEAFVLVALFAVFGYLFGILTASVILVIMDIPIKLSFLHILLVLFISFVLGIGAGIKPAINAANANPASLLR